MERTSPDLVGAGHGHVKKALVHRKSQAVRRYAVANESVQLSIWREAVDSIRLIRHARLSLIGEIQVVPGVEEQVIRAFEPFQIVSRQIRRDFTALASYERIPFECQSKEPTFKGLGRPNLPACNLRSEAFRLECRRDRWVHHPTCKQLRPFSQD